MTGTTYLTDDFGICSIPPVIFPTHTGETNKKETLKSVLIVSKNRYEQVTSKWLVLIRPRLAGFEVIGDNHRPFSRRFIAGRNILMAAGNLQCLSNPRITPINADTEKACFICVHLRVPRAKAFSLVPSFFALASPRKRSGFAYPAYFAVKILKSLQFKLLCLFCLKSERFFKILSNIY